VTVTVTDDHGHYVKGLPKSAFHVSEDGKPQSVSHFYSQDIPLELMVAVDISGSMESAMPKLKKAVERKIDDTLDEMEDDRGPGRANG
jgi:hypothetical protein